MSSSAPGASPTNMSSASGFPTPKTTCSRDFTRCSHFIHARIGPRSASSRAALSEPAASDVRELGAAVCIGGVSAAGRTGGGESTLRAGEGDGDGAGDFGASTPAVSESRASAAAEACAPAFRCSSDWTARWTMSRAGSLMPSLVFWGARKYNPRPHCERDLTRILHSVRCDRWQISGFPA